MKLLVILLLAVLAVGSFAHYRRRPIRRFILPQRGDDVYAASLGGAPVGIYHRVRRHGFPYYYPRSSVYGASLGGAPVGMYSREGGRRGSRGVYGASLGKAPVGMYTRE